MLTAPSEHPDEYDRMLLLAESRQYLSSPADGLAFITSVRDAVGAVFASITVDSPDEVTLTSSSGSGIPVTVSNGDDEGLRVTVQLLSQNLQGTPSTDLELAPGESQTVTFHVDALRTGRFEVLLLVLAPAGRIIVEQTYHRALDGVQPDRARDHDRGRARPGRTVGEEAAATSDVVTPEGPRMGAPPENPLADVPDDTPRAFVRNTVVMSAGTALSRLTGFLRLAAMAYALGITESRLADAYNIANITPNIIYELALGGILTSVVVPVVVEWLQERGRDEAWDVVRRLFTFAAVTLSAIAVLGILLAPWIVRVYTSGIADDADREAVVELATFFLRWFMPQIVFYGVGAVAIGLLNAHRRFAAPMFAPVLNNLIVIATFAAFVAMPDPAPGSGDLVTTAQGLVLAIGTTAGVVGMTLALWPFVRATGFRFRWLTGWRHEAVVRIARLATWVFVYVAANQVLVFVVIVLAGREKGWYTAYASAFILFQLPHAIFAVSIFTALVPAMSGRWAAGDVDGFRRHLSQGLRATAAIVVPAALGYLVLARPIVRLLLEHGATTAVSGDLVADVLVAFAVGLFPFSAFQLLLRAFYSMQDTRTPALVNVAAIAINVVLDLVLFFVFDLGVQGLALGFALQYVFGAAALAVIIRRRLHGLDGRRFLATLGLTALAGAATAVVAWAVARWLGDAIGTATLGQQAVQVFGAVAAGLVVFAVSATLLRIEEVAMVRNQALARWRR